MLSIKTCCNLAKGMLAPPMPIVLTKSTILQMPIVLCIVVGAIGTESMLAQELDVDASVIKAEQDRIAAIQRAVPSAVSVFVPGGGGGGSGVVISPDGFALTNFHVSSPAGAFMRCGMADGQVYDAVIVGIDPVGDLALIKLFGRDDFPTATMADSNTAEQGDWCFVVGNPFLLADNLEPTVTWGMISGVHRYQYPSGTLLEYADCIQTDASVNPGNSGGPIFNAEGELLGIVGRCSFEKRGRINVGVGYAISINQCKNFLGYLHSGRVVDHATLGATVVTSEDGRVTVSNILDNSDGYRRGLRYGDEILEVAGRPVDTANTLQNILGTLPRGWRVPVVFRHEGARNETYIRLSGVHGTDELIERMSGAMPPPPPRPQAPGDDQEDPQDEDIEPEDAEPEDEDVEPKDAEPQDVEPNDKKPKRELPRRRAPKGHTGSKAKLPSVIKEHYESRRGFGNYFYNSQHQDRVWENLKSTVPGGNASRDSWTIRAATAGQVDVVIKIQGQAQTMDLGANQVELTGGGEQFDAVEDRELSALLVCLDLWRRFVLEGPKKFGDIRYVGTMPLLDRMGPRDVVAGTAADLETQIYSDPKSGRLESLEVYTDPDADPAEMLLKYNDDSNIPATLELRYGLEPLVTLSVSQWNDEESRVQ